MNALKLLSRDEMRNVNGGGPYSSRVLFCMCSENGPIETYCNEQGQAGGGNPESLCALFYCSGTTVHWASWGDGECDINPN